MPRLSKIGAAALAAFGWTGISSVTATYLVVAGGGAGGGETGDHGGGGGGAGGYRTGTASLNPSLSYTVTVGAGGAGTTGTGPSGSSSIFSVTTSAGGGGGGANGSSSPTAGIGVAGGSGGGGAADNSVANAGTPGGAGNTPSTSPAQGFAGGQGLTDNASYSAAGGGGGSSAVGAGGVNGQSGAGGAGTANTITGSSVTYAGGGGGGRTDQSAAGAGGSGGGGTGGTLAGNGNPGTANLGGGGGGGGRGTTTGGNGGSGIVIISYVGAQQFGGGVVTTDGTNTIHTFTTSGTLVPATPLTAQYLIVAGGGGGASGGGGAGGLLTNTGLTIDTNSNYVVTVGAGGSGGSGSSGGGVATNGTSSSFSLISSAAVGGGAGARIGNDDPGGGSSGGSGGGGGGWSGGTPPGGAGTSGQGNAGGNNGGFTASAFPAGGGGGAGAVGSNATSASIAGNGGAGTASSISGSSVTYAGGGGGSLYNGGTPGSGGSGGGGAGGSGVNGVSGTANRGGGGGGSSNTFTGGAGGSGVVIIAYPGATQQMAGGTVTISGGNVIHTFTSSGYLTPIKYASRSLRFRASNSAYLSRTTTASVTNNKIFTYSMWVKRGIINDPSVFEALIGGGPTNADTFGFGSGTNAAGDYLQLRDSGGGTFNLLTTQLFRDPSSWYHFVLAVDTTQATASNRVKLYVNGVQVTAFSTASYPAQNYVFDWNTTSTAYVLGRRSGGNAQYYFDGYMTEVNAVDGAALTPSSFGTFNSYGVWQPITYGGSYGTNGFYLTFGNNASTTTLGYDSSPQGNNWTTNNISLTAGATYDSMLDVPTLTSATVANYAVLNPLFGTSGTLASANLQVSGSGVGNTQRLSSISVSSGKWYCEITMTTLTTADPRIGFSNILDASAVSQYPGQSASSYAIYTYSPNSFTQKYNNASATNTNATPFAQGDILGIAIDLDSGKIWFAKNNTWVDSGSPSAGTNPAYTGLSGTFAAALHSSGSGSSATLSANFGQQPFTYTPPSGFVALNTYNLSTPTIPNGAAYMAATLYTGTGATQVVTNTVNGTAMQPDFVWQKSRSAARDHRLIDTNRGINNTLASNLTAAEYSGSILSSVNSNGFTLNTADQGNNSSETYVAWQWKANAGTNVSNTDGTITSTVSANTTAGFSVVIWTGGGSAGTIGHGLGVTPGMIIVKNRSGTQFWFVNHASISTTQNLYLNDTAAVQSDGIFTSRGATTFGVGTGVAGSATNYVAYVFAAVAGYSAFGSYTGNGSSDGVFVFLGLRARFLMIKRTDSTGGWVMLDTARDTYNDVDNYLYANSNATDAGSSNVLDINSNGFKIRNSWTDINANGGTYIYMAFAENPFKYSNAR